MEELWLEGKTGNYFWLLGGILILHYTNIKVEFEESVITQLRTHVKTKLGFFMSSN